MVPSWAESKPTRRMKGTWGAWPDVVAKNATRLRNAEKTSMGPLDFVLYGDSITAFLNGYSVSNKVPGNEQVWNKHFGTLRAVAMGVAGDQIGNVLWRLVNAEKPVLPPKVIGFHIGINDLIGWGSGGVPANPPTIERLKILLQTTCTMFPSSIVMVMALTPCNGAELRIKRNAHNAAAKALVQHLAATGLRVTFADCATVSGITASNGGPSASGILGDGVHMTAEGHDRHLTCMRRAVDVVLVK